MENAELDADSKSSNKDKQSSEMFAQKIKELKAKGVKKLPLNKLL
jgi:hypothetical protein